MPVAVAQEDALWAAVADPTRRRVLDSLLEHGGGTTTTLALELPVSRQAVAKHLAVLDRVGLVARSRKGREVRYTVQPERLDDAAAAAKICAAMTPRHQACETSVFDGQRLALNVDPAPAPRVVHHRTGPRPIKREPLKPVKPAAPAAPSPAR